MQELFQAGRNSVWHWQDVYLLDEPTSALDEDTEMMVLEHFIREIKKKHATLLMITHSNKVNEQFAEERIYLSRS